MYTNKTYKGDWRMFQKNHLHFVFLLSFDSYHLIIQYHILQSPLYILIGIFVYNIFNKSDCIMYTIPH